MEEPGVFNTICQVILEESFHSNLPFVLLHLIKRKLHAFDGLFDQVFMLESSTWSTLFITSSMSLV